MKRRTPEDYVTYFAPAIFLTLAGFIVAYQFVDPAPPRRITLAAGRSTGAYYEIAIDPFCEGNRSFFLQLNYRSTRVENLPSCRNLHHKRMNFEAFDQRV
jgi:hypothetical protein